MQTISISILVAGIVAVNGVYKPYPDHKPSSQLISSFGVPVVAPGGVQDVPSNFAPTLFAAAPHSTSSYDTADTSSHGSYGGVEEEKQTLDELYDLALEEGGKLIVYVGGDSPTQQNEHKKAFEARFPGMDVQLIVDLSRIQYARLDNQIARGYIIPDVIQVQPSPELIRWKSEGILLPYKPLGWKHVYPEFKDPEGYSTGLYVLSLSNNINRDIFGNDEKYWPTEAKDFLVPQLKGKIISGYPNDQDGSLYLYKLIIDKYGWKWLSGLMANQPAFVRGGTNVLSLLGNGTFGATFTADGALKDTYPVQFILPKSDPFVSWAERAAIIKGTKRLAAAKLYLSWFLEVETQLSLLQWSVRKDVRIPKGYKSIFDYPGQTDPVGYDKFVEDRAAVEIFRDQVTLYLGETGGSIPTGDLGLDPARMSVAALAGLSQT